MAIYIGRRELIGVLGSVVVWPLGVRAAARVIRRNGVFASGTVDDLQSLKGQGG
jgi:hypothetical protein